MRNGHWAILLLFAVLLSVNMVSAVMLYQSTLNLKEGSTINMNLLEKYCSEDTCNIYEDQSMKRIMFRVEEGDGLTISAIEKKESNLYRITLSATTYENKPTNSQISEGLKLLVKTKIVSGMSQEDVAEISNVLGDSTVSIYFKPSTCGESYSDIPDVDLVYDFTDLNENGWLIADPGCSLENYEDGCPKLNCWGDFQRGELDVFFYENVTEEEARNLIDSLGLKVEHEDYFDSVPETTGALLVLVPEGKENQFKSTFENQPTVKEVKIPELGRALGGDSFPNVESLEFLSLTQKSSNLIYWITGIVLVVIVILFLVFRKKK